MPKGIRRSPIEKLQDELQNTKEAIAQYKTSIKTHEVRIKQIEEEIKTEKLKELSVLIEENGLSLEDARELLINNKKS